METDPSRSFSCCQGARNTFPTSPLIVFPPYRALLSNTKRHACFTKPRALTPPLCSAKAEAQSTCSIAGCKCIEARHRKNRRFKKDGTANTRAVRKWFCVRATARVTIDTDAWSCETPVVRATARVAIDMGILYETPVVRATARVAIETDAWLCETPVVRATARVAPTRTAQSSRHIPRIIRCFRRGRACPCPRNHGLFGHNLFLSSTDLLF
jgi:hypothetical protein